ncbi:MAG: Lrp/AsnC family transcriptional regulator [Candidatus Micrarchaeota archaeon]
MDEIDKQIIGMLLEDSSRPNVDVAKCVNLSEASVRKRVRKLIERGVIRKFTLELGEEMSPVSALVFVAVNANRSASEIVRKVKEIAGVGRVFEITGEYDVAAFVSARSLEEMNKSVDLIRKIQYVKNTDTKMVLKSWE